MGEAKKSDVASNSVSNANGLPINDSTATNDNSNAFSDDGTTTHLSSLRPSRTTTTTLATKLVSKFEFKEQTATSKPDDAAYKLDATLLKYDPNTNIKTILDKFTTNTMAKAVEEDIVSESKDVTEVDPQISESIIEKDILATTLSDEELERELAALDDGDGSHEDEDDDEAVYLQQLGLNFGLSARSSYTTGRSRLGSRNKVHSALSKGYSP